MKRLPFFFILLVTFFTWNSAHAQHKDTVLLKKDSVVRHQQLTDSLKKAAALKKQSDPRRATLYSTFLPGLGQIYNRKYWKLPLVYAAVGIPAYTFFDNKKWYNKTRYALAVIANGSYKNTDSLNRVDIKLRNFVINPDGTPNFYGSDPLKNYRDQFRQYEDYSVLFFLLFWGLNIVDATVDAHLKNFNVSDDLSLHMEPTWINAANVPGLSFVFDIHKAKPKPLFLRGEN